MDVVAGGGGPVRTDGSQKYTEADLNAAIDMLAKQDEQPDPPFFIQWLRWFRQQKR